MRVHGRELVRSEQLVLWWAAADAHTAVLGVALAELRPAVQDLLRLAGERGDGGSVSSALAATAAAGGMASWHCRRARGTVGAARPFALADSDAGALGFRAAWSAATMRLPVLGTGAELDAVCAALDRRARSALAWVPFAVASADGALAEIEQAVAAGRGRR